MDINTASQVKANHSKPQLSPGDTVRVNFRVKEANRERVQTLHGVVMKVNGGLGGGNFTVRRVTYGVGVEHTFPFASPLMEKVEVLRHGKVRRAKLYYMRGLTAKEARLKERRKKVAEKPMDEEAVTEEDEVEGEEDEETAEQSEEVE